MVQQHDLTVATTADPPPRLGEAGSPTRPSANQKVLAANRANAARSTGPRTRAGKAVVARNALRHGLSVPVLADASLAAEAAALAQQIAGKDESEPRRAAALRIAEAQVDVLRIRRVRLQIMTEGFGADDITARLMRLDRYERRALSRRETAIRAFDSLDAPAVRRRRRNPWVAVAAFAGLRGLWPNKAKSGRPRNPWAAVAAAAGLRGLFRRSPKGLSVEARRAKAGPSAIARRATADERGPVGRSAKRERGFRQNKPDLGAAASTARPVRRSPKGEGGCRAWQNLSEKLNSFKGAVTLAPHAAAPGATAILRPPSVGGAIAAAGPPLRGLAPDRERRFADAFAAAR